MVSALVIAVDGPAASGKGTIAKALARHLGLSVLDTGLLYRATWLILSRDGQELAEPHATEAARRIGSISPDEPELRGERASKGASVVSALPGVRAALFDYQRDFACQPGGAVLDGRDIGTVIAPDAHAKLFVTAAPEVRARRRWAELAKGDDAPSYEAVLADILARDARDAGRSTAPLSMAPDAALLDTTDLDIDEAIRRAIGEVEGRLAAVGIGPGRFS